MLTQDRRLAFSGNGTWDTPLIQACLENWEAPRGQETLCIMGGSRVSASLSSPVAIAPQLPQEPFTSMNPPRRCVDRSVDPLWQVQNFLYQHHTSQTQAGTKRSYDLSVNLTNFPNGDSVACSITVDEDAASRKGAMPWVRCPQSTMAGTKVTSTEIRLDTVYGILWVRQAWNCTDGTPGIDS